MSFRTRVLAFGGSLIAATLVLEAIGYFDTVGVTPGGLVASIPLEIAGPILFVVAVLFVLDPLFR